jgi:hypothetical protein
MPPKQNIDFLQKGCNDFDEIPKICGERLSK